MIRGTEKSLRMLRSSSSLSPLSSLLPSTTRSVTINGHLLVPSWSGCGPNRRALFLPSSSNNNTSSPSSSSSSCSRTPLNSPNTNNHNSLQKVGNGGWQPQRSLSSASSTAPPLRASSTRLSPDSTPTATTTATTPPTTATTSTTTGFLGPDFHSGFEDDRAVPLAFLCSCGII
jgi:hypothetical protein